MFFLNMRMYMLVAMMFAFLYMIISLFAYAMGVANLSVYFIITLMVMGIQYMIGPKIVEWSMRVRYVNPQEYPQLFEIVRGLAEAAKIPMPRIAVSPLGIPNAFAYGRWLSDGRVCVTQGLLGLLTQNELRAVLGHEISHIKNRDVLTITLLSVVPLILWRISFHLLFFGGRGGRRNAQNTVLFGLASLVLYFITNLIVLYGSRIREYFADRGSVILGNHPQYLASALYKLVYGNARIPREQLRQVEGVKAFFASDPSRAGVELRELRHIDQDLSGDIDARELEMLRTRNVRLKGADKFFELFSTHPNMLKRIKKLSTYIKA